MIWVLQLSGDDWQATYFDGRLVSQGHSDNLWEIMRALIEAGDSVGAFESYDITQFGWDGSDPDSFPEILDLEQYEKGPR